MTHHRGPVRTDGWSLIVQALTRPYPVTLPMVVLVLPVPCYIFIAQDVADAPVHVPALPLLAVVASGIVGLFFMAAWVAYLMGVSP